jgi:PE family
MSFLTTQPDLLLAAAGQLEAIGSAVTAANSMASFAITGVIPAAADEVSAVTAAAFAGYGQQYQAISAEASMIHEQFVRALGLSADSYADTEAANATQAAGGHVAPAMPVHMVPGGPARPAPAPTRVGPGAPNRMTPTAPAGPVTAPAGPVPAAPSPVPANPATPVSPGWYGGGYGGDVTPQRGGYAGYGAAHYGGQQAPYGRGAYGAHPAAPVEHVAPAHPAPVRHVEHVAPAHVMPAEHAVRAGVAAQPVSPSQLLPFAPVHRAPQAIADMVPVERVVPMHLPPGEQIEQVHRAFTAAAGRTPVPALA